MNKLVKSLSISALGLCCSMGLVSCGTLYHTGKSLSHKIKKNKEEKKKNSYDINDNSDSGQGGLNELRSLNTSQSRNQIVAHGQLSPEEDIQWAPEDPDIPIAGLEGISVSEKPVDDWFVSYKDALQESRKTGKPLMVWFTRTRNSPFCKVLSNELFSTAEFESWADENVIRLRIDASIKGKSKGATDGERIDMREYVETLKTRHKVKGHPSVLMLSARGTEFGRYNGYKSGTAVYYLGRLKNSAQTASEDYHSWRAEMEGKGYRVWHNNSGKSVFAKVSRYKEGKIALIQPNGRKSVTSVNKLSGDDQRYIADKIKAARSN